MSSLFRDFVKAVGSGQHTSKDLSRSDAALATQMMLRAEATPAQIGAFLIAQRIKRPTPAEIAGMLDAYDTCGPSVPNLNFSQPLAIFGHPYDGRSRTAPIAPLVALLLGASGSPVLLHGSTICPTKYGVPLVELWQQLGVDWTAVTLDQVARILETALIGFIFLPTHFPLAQDLMTYRDQIGKRPPLATLELIWAPYAGSSHILPGFVHPPTEDTIIRAFELRGQDLFTTVKGLEGSCDLPRDRATILNENGERRILKAREFDLAGPEAPYTDLTTLATQMKQVLTGEPCELEPAVLWTSGYFLHRLGSAPDVASGIQKAREILHSGQALKHLHHLQECLRAHS